MTLGGERSIQILPGQYRDAETGLFYNYFRDYDPQTGRYVQSDPIGLRGGINPYVYVRGDPMRKRDPRGLADDPLDYFVDQNPAPYQVDPYALVPQRGPVSGTCLTLCLTRKMVAEAMGLDIVQGIGELWGGKPGSALSHGAHFLHRAAPPIMLRVNVDACSLECELDESCPAWNSAATQNFPRLPQLVVSPDRRR